MKTKVGSKETNTLTWKNPSRIFAWVGAYRIGTQILSLFYFCCIRKKGNTILTWISAPSYIHSRSLIARSSGCWQWALLTRQIMHLNPMHVSLVLIAATLNGAYSQVKVFRVASLRVQYQQSWLLTISKSLSPSRCIVFCSVTRWFVMKESERKL